MSSICTGIGILMYYTILFCFIQVVIKRPGDFTSDSANHTGNMRPEDMNLLSTYADLQRILLLKRQF